MSDLVEWLRAQLDEDERGARNCLDRSWRPDGANSCQVFAAREDGSAAYRTIAWCRNGHDDDFANSLHIAAWDPARVLAEVAAKRRIIDYFAEDAAIAWSPKAQGLSREEWLLVSAARDTIKLLALPYAERPGYDDAWRP